MGVKKKETSRKTRQHGSAQRLGNVSVKGENFFRNAREAQQLKSYKDGKPQRNAQGQVVSAAKYQNKTIPTARVAPHRKWFTNTRVISQDSLTTFRSAIAERASDPYHVLLRSNKLPLSLIQEGRNHAPQKHQANSIIQVSPFSATLGPKSQRKRVHVNASNLAELAEDAGKSLKLHTDSQEQAAAGNDRLSAEEGDPVVAAIESIFSKGKSKRIWNETYKVLDASDVAIHVLDARDPFGTRCWSIEHYLRNEAPHKHVIFVLNKIDLVPTANAAAWVKRLATEFPTLALHSSITDSFSYPNVGKSSVINTLRGKKVATVASIPGETKVWQYITLTKRIYLIDCPGIVPPSKKDTPQDLLLRGSIRIENVDQPAQYIPAVLVKVKRHHLERTYDIQGWANHVQFLEMLARKSGRLFRRGEPDVDGVAKMVLHDFMGGRLPWFSPLPAQEEAGFVPDQIEIYDDRNDNHSEFEGFSPSQ